MNSTIRAPFYIFFLNPDYVVTRSHPSLRSSYKYMRLSAYWQWNLAHERARISAVIVKSLIVAFYRSLANKYAANVLFYLLLL